jgi:hypothetical protein
VDLVAARWRARDALRDAAADSIRTLVASGGPDGNPIRVEVLRSRVVARARAYAGALRDIGVREQEILAEVKRGVPATASAEAQEQAAHEQLERWCDEGYAASVQDSRTNTR